MCYLNLHGTFFQNKKAGSFGIYFWFRIPGSIKTEGSCFLISVQEAAAMILLSHLFRHLLLGQGKRIRQRYGSAG